MLLIRLNWAWREAEEGGGPPSGWRAHRPVWEVSCYSSLKGPAAPSSQIFPRSPPPPPTGHYLCGDKLTYSPHPPLHPLRCQAPGLPAHLEAAAWGVAQPWHQPCCPPFCPLSQLTWETPAPRDQAVGAPSYRVDTPGLWGRGVPGGGVLGNRFAPWVRMQEVGLSQSLSQSPESWAASCGDTRPPPPPQPCLLLAVPRGHTLCPPTPGPAPPQATQRGTGSELLWVWPWATLCGVQGPGTGQPPPGA